MGTQQKTQGQEGQGMEIDVKINSISMDGTILATASINLNQCLAIRNVRLMNGEKGCSCPCRPTVQGPGNIRISVSPSRQGSGQG